MKRVFYGRRKGKDEENTALNVAALAAMFEASGVEAVIVDGKTEWESSFRAAGSWNAWCHEVACGEDEMGPRYDLFIFEEEVLGKGNGTIARMAHDAGKKVLVWDGTENFAEVESVDRLDGDDYFNWCVLRLRSLAS